MTTIRTRLLHSLFRRTDIAWLAVLRILFGFTMSVSAFRFIAYGWIDDFWVKPAFHFKYWGFAWVEPLSQTGMHALFWCLAVLGLAFAAGFYFRFVAIAFVLGFTYVQLIDVATYLNHYYLVSLVAFLFAMSPAHRAFSIDAWRKGETVRTIGAIWLALFRFQVGVVYTFAGLAKANADWLIHGEPLRIWLSSKTDVPVLGPLFAYPFVPLAMSWAGFLFDTSVIWFLLWRRTRPFAYVAVIVFHTLTRILFPIGMFPFIMVVGALVFFPPNWPRRILDFVSRRRGSNTEPASLPALPGVSRRWTFAFVGWAIFCVIQVALPVRFLAYGGNVRWHEQGMRFSWRVMVREKNGSVTFVVRNRKSGQVWHVAPRTYLTQLQEREMSGQPDLILQLAHRVEHDFVRGGLGPVEVHAHAVASLNGRRVRPLIDPVVNLAQIEDGIAFANWITPSPEDPPPKIRPTRTIENETRTAKR